MEYATRAGAATCRSFGETDEMLPKYAWYAKNSQDKTWPVGMLKPNDLGLFDMHGNAYAWTNGAFRGDYPRGGGVLGVLYADHEDPLALSIEFRRVCRGGSLSDASALIRSALRVALPSDQRNFDLGFRVARTIAP